MGLNGSTGTKEHQRASEAPGHRRAQGAGIATITSRRKRIVEWSRRTTGRACDPSKRRGKCQRRTGSVSFQSTGPGLLAEGPTEMRGATNSVGGCSNRCPRMQLTFHVPMKLLGAAIL